MIMSVKDMMQEMIGEYVENFSIEKNLDYTLRELGIDSLDQMELAYNVGEKLDLKRRIPEDLSIGKIIDHLENTIGDKILEDI
jgi:acyl carrier protein